MIILNINKFIDHIIEELATTRSIVSTILLLSILLIYKIYQLRQTQKHTEIIEKEQHQSHNNEEIIFSKDHAFNFLRENEIDKVLIMMLSHIEREKNDDNNFAQKHKELILLSNRHKILIYNSRNNLISDSDKAIEQNKINKTLYEIIEDF